MRALKNVRDATRQPYEIILVSPFNPQVDGLEGKVIWIDEPAGTGTGCNAGHAKALDHMTGEFVTPWVDDHFYADGWDLVALPDYEAGEKRHTKGKPFSLGLRHSWPYHVGTLFGMYYPYFPVIRRKYLDTVGWFDAEYKQGFADSDLAMRIWQAGGRCEWSSQSLVVVHPDDDRKNGAIYANKDYELAVERWAPKYGKGWATADLRDFNIDVEPRHVPALIDGNSIVHNAPDFRELMVQAGWRRNEGWPH